MTEPTDRDPTPADHTDWLIGDEPARDRVESPPRAGHRTALVAAGLVAAGALVGGVAVAALRPQASTATDGSAAFATGGQVQGGQVPGGQLPGGQTLPGQGQGGFGGGPGGVDGEQRLSGTVTAVHAASVTIRTSHGTTAYAVTSQTEIVRNGAVASLSAVRAGDDVFVHLIPASGSSYVVERLFAQSGGGSAAGGGTTGSST